MLEKKLEFLAKAGYVCWRVRELVMNE